MLLPRAEYLPDARSRKIVKDAFEWALENPEAIQIYSRTPTFKYAHLPNIAVFPQVLGGIERKSREWRRNVIEIVHDQQSQFGPTLKGWHDLTSNAKPGSITLLGGEKVEVRSVAGSKLVISDAESSAGIQLIDVILWLFKRLSDGDALPENCLDFMNYVIRMGGMYDLSLENISRYLSETLTRLEDVPLSEEQLKKAQELLEFDEERRQEKMLMYYEQKLKATKT